MLLLAQNEARPLIEFTLAPLWNDNGFPLAVMGILVVFSALLLVVVCISILPRVLNRLGPASPEVLPAAPLAVDDDELSEETLVVIAAAVAEVLDRPHRIVNIRGLGAAEGWSLEGRMKHHLSHRLHNRGRQ